MPRVIAKVSVPLLSAGPRDVEFLVDTGASVTMLQLIVMADLGVSVDALRAMPIEDSFGVGGVAAHARQRGEIEFLQDDGSRVSYGVWFRIALEPPSGEAAPSVLGMNVLSAFRVMVSGNKAASRSKIRPPSGQACAVPFG